MKETFPLKNSRSEKVLGQHDKHLKEKRRYSHVQATIDITR